jgi:hypothetical protein
MEIEKETSGEEQGIPKMRRHWYQYSLWALLAAVTIIAVILSIITSFGLDLVAGFSGLAISCVFVLLLALALVPLDWMVSRLPYWTSLILAPILYGVFAVVFSIFGEAIDQPHPIFANGSDWLTRGAVYGGQFFPFVVIAIAILVAVDGAVQGSRPRDGAYYPRLGNVGRGLGLLHVRLILIIGGLFIVGYYAPTVIEVYSAHQGSMGLVWPPKRVFAVCQLLWGLLWLADSEMRPKYGTMTAAVGYLCITLLFAHVGGVLRE